MTIQRLASFEYFRDSIYSYKVEVIQFVTGEKCSPEYINLRAFFVGGDGMRPTKHGLCITVDEMRKILPFLERLEEFSFGENRKIRFERMADPMSYLLSLTKQDGKTQGFSMNTTAIKCLTDGKAKYIDPTPGDIV